MIRELVCYGHCMQRSLWSPICFSSLRMEKILPMVGKVLGSWALSLNVGIWIGKVCLIHLQPWVCNKFLKISLLWVTIEYFLLECCVITTFSGQWIKLDNQMFDKRIQNQLKKVAENYTYTRLHLIKVKCFYFHLNKAHVKKL